MFGGCGILGFECFDYSLVMLIVFGFLLLFFFLKEILLFLFSDL